MKSTIPCETGEKIQPIEQAYIEKIEIQFVKIFGIPRIGARILGYLFISPQPKTIEQIRIGLRISHGSVSTNLRLLTSMGLIQKVTWFGERCDFYLFSPDAWNVMHQKTINTLQDLSRLVSAGLDELSPTGSAHQRMVELAELSTLALEKINEAMKEWQEYLVSR